MRNPTNFDEIDMPLVLSEEVLQEIWSKQDVNPAELKTSDGLPLTILNPGQWNKINRPDFTNAKIKVGSEEICGDIQLHFFEKDWFFHGHQDNPLYDKVILHVVLFPSPQKLPPLIHNGRPIKTTFLLTALRQSLEEYSEEYALLKRYEEAHANANLAINKWETLSSVDPQAIIDSARFRWTQKHAFIQKRLNNSSLEETAHQLVLEVLGYKKNRIPMASLAHRIPLAEMKKYAAESLFNEELGHWHLSGLRPANHPKARLQQYLNLLQRKMDWPEFLKKLSPTLSQKYDLSLTTPAFRKTYKLPLLAEIFAQKVLQGEIGGTRLHTIIVDALLPLLAAQFSLDLFPLWYNWTCGDISDEVKSAAKKAHFQIRCNGIHQGVLHYIVNEK